MKWNDCQKEMNVYVSLRFIKYSDLTAEEKSEIYVKFSFLNFLNTKKTECFQLSLFSMTRRDNEV